MAGSQEQIDFGPAGRFAEHLARCGFSRVQARLAALVFGDGHQDPAMLEISCRTAANQLGCNERSVRDAAARLSRESWFDTIPQGRGKPPMYRLRVVEARSLATKQQRAAEYPVAAPPADKCGPVGATEGQWGPVRGSEGPVGFSYQDPELKPDSSSHDPINHSSTPRSPSPPRTSPQRPAVPVLAWKPGQVTDDELVAAVRAGNVVLLAAMYEQAHAKMGWFEPSPDAWLRFLTGCHHCATARLVRSRMARLVCFAKYQGLDVSRMTQASDQWAARIVASSHRDRELVAMGRMCGGVES